MGDTERILEAVDGVRGEVGGVRKDVKCLDGKVGKLNTKVTGHLAEHKGQEKAEAKAAAAKDDDRENEKTFSSRLKLALVIGAMLVSAVIYIVTGIGSTSDATDKLQGSIDQLTRALGRVLDKPDTAAPRTVPSRTASTASTDSASTRGGS